MSARYNFDRIIERRGTASLKWDSSVRLTGMDGLLPLWVADMDFEAPPEIREPMARRLEHGIYGYTVEPESYFQAARQWMRKRHTWNVERDWMLASPGVIPCLSAAILAFTSPGDGIIIQPPVYHPFAMRITGNGRRVVENPLVLSGTRWEIDFEGLEKVIDAGTRMLILCSPHNPVGRVWRRQELERLAGICVRKGIIIVSDEIHFDLIMPGFKHVPIASLSREVSQATVTLVAATKTFNIAGLGGSIAIAESLELRKRLDATQHAVFAGLANAFAATASEAAWREGESWLDELLAYVEANYRFTVSFLEERLPTVRVLPLEGTYLPLMDLRGLGLTDDELLDRLRRTGGVWLDEGRKFGRGGQGFQRLNVACPRAILSDALERVARALSSAARSAPRPG
ncbi:MAG: MalY/PatB family protein [Spirochaetia bacterium]